MDSAESGDLFVKSYNWKDSAELIGIAAIVVSLIFVGLQLVQSQTIATAERFDTTVSNRLYRNDLVIQHSGLLAKANNGEQLTESEQISLNHLIDSLWSEAFFGSRANQVLAAPGESGARIVFSRFLYQNSGARQEWQNYRNYRHKTYEATGRFSGLIEFDKLIDTDLARFDESFQSN